MRKRKWTKTKSCGKTRYRDNTEAITALHKIQSRSITHPDSSRTVQPVRAYWCHLCLGWHLTSKHDQFSTNEGTNESA